MNTDRAGSQLALAAANGAPAAEPAVGASKVLDGTAKAAIVVRLLLNEGADLPLEELPEELQARLTTQMGQMGLVDRDTLSTVVHEFADALDGIGLSFPHGLANALAAMDGKISPQTAARLRKEAGVRQAGDPWQRLKALPTEELAGLAQAESIEVAAVLLSKLNVEKAAELLGTLPGPLARRITYAISLTESVTPEAVDRIGLSLAAQLDRRPLAAFEDGPDARVGAILNQSPATTREDMLAALDDTDADFASSVRRNIFTFADLPERLMPRDVPKVLRAVDQPTLIVALLGAQATDDAPAAEFLLANTSKRMADALREEIDEHDAVRPRDVEAAISVLVGSIRALETAGEITLHHAEET